MVLESTKYWHYLKLKKCKNYCMHVDIICHFRISGDLPSMREPKLVLHVDWRHHTEFWKKEILSEMVMVKQWVNSWCNMEGVSAVKLYWDCVLKWQWLLQLHLQSQLHCLHLTQFWWMGVGSSSQWDNIAINRHHITVRIRWLPLTHPATLMQHWYVLLYMHISALYILSSEWSRLFLAHAKNYGLAFSQISGFLSPPPPTYI